MILLPSSTLWSTVDTAADLLSVNKDVHDNKQSLLVIRVVNVFS